MQLVQNTFCLNMPQTCCFSLYYNNYLAIKYDLIRINNKVIKHVSDGFSSSLPRYFFGITGAFAEGDANTSVMRETGKWLKPIRVGPVKKNRIYLTAPSLVVKTRAIPKIRSTKIIHQFYSRKYSKHRGQRRGYQQVYRYAALRRGRY